MLVVIWVQSSNHEFIRGQTWQFSGYKSSIYCSLLLFNKNTNISQNVFTGLDWFFNDSFHSKQGTITLSWMCELLNICVCAYARVQFRSLVHSEMMYISDNPYIWSLQNSTFRQKIFARQTSNYDDVLYYAMHPMSGWTWVLKVNSSTRYLDWDINSNGMTMNRRTKVL